MRNNCFLKLKTYVLLVLLSIITPILSSCGDGMEPETLGYVVAIGIDKSTENQDEYDITLQFANPSVISGGSSEEGGNGSEESIDNITVTASGIYPAVNLANHIISKKFVLSHTKLIVFSNEIATAGIKPFLETIGRSPDIRPNTYFAVSKGNAKDFLGTVNPKTEVNPVRYYTMIFENDYSGFIPQNKSQDFYFYFDSKERCAVMPMCSKKDEEKGKESKSENYQYKSKDYKAGEIETDNNEIQVMGTAIFDRDIKIAEIGEIETEIYNILTGAYKTSYVSYKYSKIPNIPITVSQEQEKKPKISVDTASDVPKIKITVYIEADFSSGTSEFSVEDNIYDFAKEASDEMEGKIKDFLTETKKIGADIVGFGSYAKRNFLTTADFERYNWKEKYKNAEFKVEVDFKIRRTGLIVRSK